MQVDYLKFKECLDYLHSVNRAELSEIELGIGGKFYTLPKKIIRDAGYIGLNNKDWVSMVVPDDLHIVNITNSKEVFLPLEEVTHDS